MALPALLLLFYEARRLQWCAANVWWEACATGRCVLSVCCAAGRHRKRATTAATGLGSGACVRVVDTQSTNVWEWVGEWFWEAISAEIHLTDEEAKW